MKQSKLLIRSNKVALATRELISELMSCQDRLSAEERMEVWEILQAGYCKYCGGQSSTDSPCQCWNDE